MRCLLDLGGASLVVLTWVLFGYNNYTTVVYVLDAVFTSPTPFHSSVPYTPFGAVCFLFFRVVVILALLSHFRAVVTNPSGLQAAPILPPQDVRGPRICKPCGGRWKPPRAHHCRKCQICIFRMDHHCPWINNCVGLVNQKFFILFLIYTVLACTVNLTLLLAGAICRFQTLRVTGIPWKSLAVTGLSLLVCVFFFFMAQDFLSEQYEALESNSTLIESYQSTHGSKGTYWDSLYQVFGNDWYFWFLPTTPSIRIDYEEPVFLEETIALHLQKKLPANGRRTEAANFPTSSFGSAIPPSFSSTTQNVENMKRAASLSCEGSEKMHQRKEQQTGLRRRNCKNPNILDTQNRFMNVYVRPKHDIGVDIDEDDHSQFVRLSSSGSSYSAEEEVQSDHSGRSASSCPSLRQRRSQKLH